MQESLLNTVKKLQSEEKINVEELEVVLNSDIEEVVTLCKKACLKPKTDSLGNAYFTRRDVDMLKKIKELYVQSNDISEMENQVESANMKVADLTSPKKKINLLEKARNRVKNESALAVTSHPMLSIQQKIDKLEDNLTAKMSELLSEKMDGFDEIIVELIRSKTENENLRAKVDSLNKQVYILKNELASFSPLAFGFYTKQDSKD